MCHASCMLFITTNDVYALMHYILIKWLNINVINENITNLYNFFDAWNICWIAFFCSSSQKPFRFENASIAAFNIFLIGHQSSDMFDLIEEHVYGEGALKTHRNYYYIK